MTGRLLLGYEFSSWFGFVVPKGTPAAVIQRLQEASYAALKGPEVAARLVAGMTRPVAWSPREFAQLIARENERWLQLIKQYGIKID